MTDDRLRLLDIREAIANIEKYAAHGRERFDHDELLQVWIVHHLQIIGEACRALSEAFRSGHPEIPWPQIVAMRNILVHHYFGIDLNEVWRAVERDLPDLKRKVEAILAGSGPPTPPKS